MWILRNGHHIRVNIEIDPCWNNEDIWRATNLFARFKALGHDEQTANSIACAAVWKAKWQGTVYNSVLESQLLAFHPVTLLT
jgi:hypothetical protein